MIFFVWGSGIFSFEPRGFYPRSGLLGPGGFDGISGKAAEVWSMWNALRPEWPHGKDCRSVNRERLYQKTCVYIYTYLKYTRRTNAEQNWRNNHTKKRTSANNWANLFFKSWRTFRRCWGNTYSYGWTWILHQHLTCNKNQHKENLWKKLAEVLTSITRMKPQKQPSPCEGEPKNSRIRQRWVRGPFCWAGKFLLKFWSNMGILKYDFFPSSVSGNSWKFRVGSESTIHKATWFWFRIFFVWDVLRNITRHAHIDDRSYFCGVEDEMLFWGNR